MPNKALAKNHLGFRSSICEPLTNWGIRNDPSTDSRSSSGGYWPQILLVRDRIARSLFGIYHWGDDEPPKHPEHYVWAVGEHTSKSILLPVMYFKWEEIEFMMRFNYHDWAVTVRSKEPLDIKELGWLYDTEESTYLREVYFEGFPPDFVAGPYTAPDYQITSQFSAKLLDSNELWTFCWLIKVAKVKAMNGID